jgi:3-isopropylmalate/(R)-2-methylmalate dehydratase small subunit
MSRLWLFEETINTDVLAPGFYMKSPLAKLSQHCLEAVRPEFASKVKKGDVLLAGDNMGVGSSREQAAEV